VSFLREREAVTFDHRRHEVVWPPDGADADGHRDKAPITAAQNGPLAGHGRRFSLRSRRPLVVVRLIRAVVSVSSRNARSVLEAMQK
jgi:hypothetical protein